VVIPAITTTALTAATTSTFHGATSTGTSSVRQRLASVIVRNVSPVAVAFQQQRRRRSTPEPKRLYWSGSSSSSSSSSHWSSNPFSFVQRKDQHILPPMSQMIKTARTLSSNNDDDASGSTVPATTTTPPPQRTLTDFLRHCKLCPTHHIVIGNEAGDVDSIISAIAYAYVHYEYLFHHPYHRNHAEDDDDGGGTTKNDTRITPMVSIPRTDLQTQRPETIFLLQLAGISCTEHLWCIQDDDLWPQLSQPPAVDQPVPPAAPVMTIVDVTLVDHNRFVGIKNSKYLDHTKPFYNVVGILDHHWDEGYHTDTCQKRYIAYANHTALVASTCTLIVEEVQTYYYAATTAPSYGTNIIIYPAPLALLLLGVILLDSVNMNPDAGKVTSRDIAAVHALVHHTDWGQNLSVEAQNILQVRSSLSSSSSNSSSSSHQPNTTALFNALQNAKFAPTFWNALSVYDALRLDYKKFAPTTINDLNVFGVSTVLIPLTGFTSKNEVFNSIHLFMNDMQIGLLGIMFAYTDSDDSSKLNRELILIGTSANLPIVEQMVDFLLSDGTLRLFEKSEIATNPILENTNVRLTIRSFQQMNTAASRKQVAPLLLKFFATRMT
jgi:exopolyphosphatase